LLTLGGTYSSGPKVLTLLKRPPGYLLQLRFSSERDDRLHTPIEVMDTSGDDPGTGPAAGLAKQLALGAAKRREVHPTQERELDPATAGLLVRLRQALLAHAQSSKIPGRAVVLKASPTVEPMASGKARGCERRYA
jgi:hypothetical protein